MSTFSYSAIDSVGRKSAGQLNAASRGEAFQMLSLQSLMPLNLTEAKYRSNSGPKVRPAAIAAACVLLSDQLETDVPLLRALQVLAHQTSDAKLKVALTRLAERVADGASLAEAMSEHVQLFGELEISMVRAGEEGGFLNESLRRIASVRERQEEIRGRLISALAYPLLLLVVGALVVLGMLIFFVPRFEPLFESLCIANRMPFMTTILLTVSSFLQTWGIPVLLVLFVGMMVARAMLPPEEIRVFRDRTSLNLKGLGPVIRSLAIARFCRVLGSLLQNGVPMLQSLEIAREATGNRILSKTIADAASHIGAGKSLAGPLAASGHFPDDVLEMLSVAEQCNKLETVLLKLADKLESRAQQQLDILLRLLEPAMMVCMAIVIGFLVIALLMPVFEGNGLI